MLGRSASYDRPSPFLILHLAWSFLQPIDRCLLAAVHPAFHQYARLRQTAMAAPIHRLLQPRPPPSDRPISKQRTDSMAAALLRFDFNYGDLLRWLGGPYTNSHRNWDDVFLALEAVSSQEPPPGYPSVDYERAYRLATEGAPLQGHFTTSYHSVSRRNLHPPSEALLNEAPALNDKLRKEEQLSYHVLLPRFLWRFITGLHLCLLTFVFRYGDPKGRLCVDPSTTIDSSDDGNANRHIPPPGTPGREDENPPIFYGTAMRRYLQWLWNLRIQYPFEDILQLTDDISAAFHRLLYHPALAIVFASVWQQFLVVPVGTIFGSRSSPSTYMVHGELRSHFAQHMPDAHLAPLTDLAARVDIGEDPPEEERLNFSQATADALNVGLENSEGPAPDRRQSSFVDDSGNAHVRRFFRTVINVSILAAYLIFGSPQDDPNRPPCINPTKWIALATHILKFLGYIIDTRLMIVIWPLDKRARMRSFLQDVFANQYGPRRRGSTPKEIARVLGLIRHGSFVAPMGIFFTLRLQFLLSDSAAEAGLHSKHWWRNKRLFLPKYILDELQRLFQSLSDDLYHHLWHRPIGLLVEREPNGKTQTDASLNGLGGWSLEFLHMWRLCIADLWATGFPRGDRHNPQYGEPDIDPLLCHINLYEFIAIFIELWICGRQMMEEHRLIPGGYCLAALADNTSALSWRRYASRTKRPPVRRVARLLLGFLAHPFLALNLRVQGHHLAGDLNTGADLLSRFEKAPSWESAITQCSNLRNLRTCRLPRELLCILSTLLTEEPTEAWFEQRMTDLWTLEPPIFESGSSALRGTQTSISA